MRKMDIGQRVEVIAKRDEYDKNQNHIVQEVPIRWEGIVTRIGITDDQMHYAYDLMGDDGFEIKNYPAPCLIHIIPGTKRKVSKIVGCLSVDTEDEVEYAEFETAVNYIIAKYSKSGLKFLLGLMYFYGKTVGIRQERQKKKARLINRQAMDLANSL